ncbi:MAG: hypothetical protein RBU37_11055 [Myxococcota bacterium]|jgi:hypothetical protein|nr:hypothetical protein [Myxococcota bacterium]
MEAFEELTAKVIARDLPRGTAFFHAMSTVPAIWSALTARGYTEAEHQYGMQRFSTMLGFRAATAPLSGPNRAQLARNKLDEWDGPNLEIARAATARFFPEQGQYLVGDLSNKDGYEAVVNVITFLERAAKLRDGTDPNRSATREQDRAAIELLAKRGVLTPEIEAELRQLIADATSTPESAPATAQLDRETYERAAVEFHAWLTDWRATARAVIRRRDHLIRLGLASRRMNKAESESDDSEG